MLLVANKPRGIAAPALDQGEFASVVIPPKMNKSCSDGAVVVTWSQAVEDHTVSAVPPPGGGAPVAVQTSRHWVARTSLKCVSDASSGSKMPPACRAKPEQKTGIFKAFDLRHGSAAELPNDAPWVAPIDVPKNPTPVVWNSLEVCDIFDGHGHVDPSKTKPAPRYGSEASGDVQLVRLPGGVLIQAGLGEERQMRVLADPSAVGGEEVGPNRYLRKTCEDPVFESNVVLIRRSDDCGATWKLVSVIHVRDFQYEYDVLPQPLDRIELTYDDVNDRLLLSGMAQGHWGGVAPIGFPLWMSMKDVAAGRRLGDSWTLLGDISGRPGSEDRWEPGNPVVHAASRYRREYFFTCAGNTPTLAWTDDDLETTPRHWAVDIAGGYPKCDFLSTANRLKKPDDAAGGPKVETGVRNATRGGFHQVLPTPAIAVSRMSGERDGVDYVWVAFPDTELVESELPGGDLDISDRQIAHVLRIRVDRSEDGSGVMGGIGSRRSVRVVNWFPIMPKLDMDSVVFPTLLTPDRVGGVSPGESSRGTVVLSWLETLGDQLFHQKARAFSETEGGKVVTLTVSNNTATPWPATKMGCGPAAYQDENKNWHVWHDRLGNVKRDCWYGDYQYGSFVKELPGGRLQFLRVWAESDPAVPVANLEAHANFLEVDGTWN